MTDLVFAFKSTGNEWLGQLIDNIDPQNPTPHNLTGFNVVYIIFKKPDGTQFPTDQQMIDDYAQGAIVEDVVTPGGPVDLTNANIKYSDPALPSFLDQRGFWEYVPAVKLGNNLIKSPHPIGFWVI